MSESVGTAPPLTPGGLLLQRWWVLIADVLLTVVLTVSAVVGTSTRLDRAITDFAIDRRGNLDDVIRAVTELGGSWVVVPVAVAAALVSWRRSPPLGAVILLAVGARYGVELVAKAAIARERPMMLALMSASGFSFPSGHVLGAVIGWGTVPAAVRMVTDRAGPWRVSVALWSFVVVAVAFSRIYLGVHWFTDTVASLLLGLLVLALVDIVGRGVPEVPSG